MVNNENTKNGNNNKELEKTTEETDTSTDKTKYKLNEFKFDDKAENNYLFCNDLNNDYSAYRKNPYEINSKYIVPNTYALNAESNPYLFDEKVNSIVTPTESDSDEKQTKNVKGHAGKQKIKLEYISKKSKRSVTFSKRKKGIMKKAFELATLTNAEISIVIANENGNVYTYVTNKFKSLVSKQEEMIKECLNREESNE